MDTCAKFHDNPSNSYRDISSQSQRINLMVPPHEKSGGYQSHYTKFHSSPSKISWDI